jgi:hypothetical protein
LSGTGAQFDLNSVGRREIYASGFVYTVIVIFIVSFLFCCSLCVVLVFLNAIPVSVSLNISVICFLSCPKFFIMLLFLIFYGSFISYWFCCNMYFIAFYFIFLSSFSPVDHIINR